MTLTLPPTLCEWCTLHSNAFLTLLWQNCPSCWSTSMSLRTRSGRVLIKVKPYYTYYVSLCLNVETYVYIAVCLFVWLYLSICMSLYHLACRWIVSFHDVSMFAYSERRGASFDGPVGANGKNDRHFERIVQFGRSQARGGENGRGACKTNRPTKYVPTFSLYITTLNIFALLYPPFLFFHSFLSPHFLTSSRLTLRCLRRSMDISQNTLTSIRNCPWETVWGHVYVLRKISEVYSTDAFDISPLGHAFTLPLGRLTR